MSTYRKMFYQSPNNTIFKAMSFSNKFSTNKKDCKDCMPCNHYNKIMNSYQILGR